MVDPRPLIVQAVFYKWRLWRFMPTPVFPYALGDEDRIE